MKTYLVSNTGYKCLDVQLCGTALLTGCISTFQTSAILLVAKIIFYRLSYTWEKINLYNNNNNCIQRNEIHKTLCALSTFKQKLFEAGSVGTLHTDTF